MRRAADDDEASAPAELVRQLEHAVAMDDVFGDPDDVGVDVEVDLDASSQSVTSYCAA
jgi:hypothetical protein